MKKTIFAAILVMAFACLCGCALFKGPMPELSSEYYVGTYYGGCGYGSYYDCFSGKVIVCTNKDLLVYMPDDFSREYELVKTLKLTDDQYDRIVSSVNRKKLYYLNPRERNDICDGDSTYIMLYDENNELLKNCGGYMPANQSFLSMYKNLLNYLPMDELYQIRSDWAEQMMAEDGMTNEEAELTDGDKAYNEELATAALGDKADTFNMDTFHEICEALKTGQLQSVEAGEDGPDHYLDIVAGDGTNYRYFHDGSGALMGVENMDTGEWPYYSCE
ncbi:hypothetical protein [Butyrivibrio sp. FC2001]|uniref:hypothetical protein n=1 Tax=Butyrivibrio sp. FC2001 TaxID=1280671 RepID=UPI000411BD46|nr:hypothetical protein [Butyrivibrio sp. FC2001]